MPNSLTDPIGILAGAPGSAERETFWIPGVSRLGSCGR